MKAAFMAGLRDVQVREIEPPMPAADEVLLQVAAVGICGSDLHYYGEGSIGGEAVGASFIPGHEIAARVTEGAARTLGMEAGTLVAVEPAHHCGRCEWCRKAHYNLCPSTVFSGAPPHAGAMSEFFAARVSQIIRVPDSFDAITTAMLEPVGVGVHAVAIAKPRVMETVAVVGCGSIGLSLVQLARLAGAGAVFAIDPVRYRAEKAKVLGADDSATHHEAVSRWTNGRGADLVLEATDSKNGMEIAAECARIGGRVVISGIPEGGTYNLTAALARRKGLTIKMTRRMGDVWEQTIRLVETGRIDVRSLATHQFPLADAADAFAVAAKREQEVIKSVVCP